MSDDDKKIGGVIVGTIKPVPAYNKLLADRIKKKRKLITDARKMIKKLKRGK